MTTVPQYDTLNMDEQLARIAKMRRDSEETSVEIRKLLLDTKLATPRVFYLGAFTAAALIGATAVIAKVFFP